MKFTEIFTVFFLAVITACNFNITDVQDIEINHYAENEKNLKLAEDLMHYDHRFIATKVPALKKTPQGVSIGYFVSSSTGKASYRILYDLKNSGVSENIEELKKGFENYIPKLVEFHISKEPIFRKLRSVGKMWAERLFSEPSKTLLEESSPLLKQSCTPEQFSEMPKKIKSLGMPNDISFIRAQYYEEFCDVPESVSLFYLATFPDGKELSIRVSMHQHNDKWAVIGFGIKEKIRSKKVVRKEVFKK